MFDAMDSGRAPKETFYDGYVVNAVIDACYRSAKSRTWEPVDLFEWRGKQEVEELSGPTPYDDRHYLIKKERMPDGRTKVILKDRVTGEIVQRTE
jgi:hypothetical protein